jgi:Family of unknown function (DUF5331)
MNVQQLRRSAKNQWLSYYEENRQWLARLGVWVNCDGQRRPSSSFILATLSVLEPQLTQMLPLIVDLSSNPDRIVMALGLNFNPDAELEAMAKTGRKLPKPARAIAETSVKQLSAATQEELPTPRSEVNLHARMDEACQGTREER